MSLIHIPTQKPLRANRVVTLLSGHTVHLPEDTASPDYAANGVYPYNGVREEADVQVETYIERDGEAILQIPTPTLEERKATKKLEIAQARRETQEAGTTVDGLEVPTDQWTLYVLEAMRNKGGRDGSISVRWKKTDGAFIALNKTQIDVLHDATFTHIQQAYQRESDLLDAIEAATTKEELAAILW